MVTTAPTRRRAEAALAGLTDSDLRRLTAAGEIRRLRHGGYVGAAEFDALERVQQHATATMAALAAHGPSTTVTHQSALVLFGVPFWGISMDRVHLGKQRRNAGRITTGLHIHSTDLPDDDLTEIDGVSVTTLARTVFDIACAVPFEQGVVVADAALHASLVTPDDLMTLADRDWRRVGQAKALAVIEFADGLSESVGESRSRFGMRRAGLPAPELQHPVLRANGTRAAICDFRWGDLVGEFDGLIKYGRLLRPGETPGDAVVREKVREDEVRDLGRRMVRWIWRDLDRPEALWGRVGAAIRQWS